MIDYKLNEYRGWLANNVTLADAESPHAMRIMTKHILMGRNYRLITETNTKDRLVFTYLWLLDIVASAKAEFGEAWQSNLLAELQGIRRKSPEQKNLQFWLAGLTDKTATNLGIRKIELPGVLDDLLDHVRSLFEDIGRSADYDDAWILLMAGASTLSRRGADKSSIGKRLEKVLIRAMLRLLGFTEGVNFWLNIGRDIEVDREADAEIQSRRGRIRVEVGLIGSGNQEVTEDKIGRVGRNGIIIFDIVGARSRIHDTAERHGVKLIQIRNNQPLIEIYRHLRPLVEIEMTEPVVTEETISENVDALPDRVFQVNPAN